MVQCGQFHIPMIWKVWPRDYQPRLIALLSRPKTIQDTNREDSVVPSWTGAGWLVHKPLRHTRTQSFHLADEWVNVKVMQLFIR